MAEGATAHPVKRGVCGAFPVQKFLKTLGQQNRSSTPGTPSSAAGCPCCHRCNVHVSSE